MPKVSVIVLIYNVEKYIEKCVRSLFSQTMIDLEFIFINDHSLDHSLEILRGIIKEYPTRKNQVKIIDMPFNCGQAICRMAGIKEATGEYVIHCDADDWVVCDAYESLYNYAITNSCDIVSSNYARVYDDESIIIETQSFEDNSYEWIKRILLNQKMGALWNHLIKRSILDNLIPPTANIKEDFVILIQSLLKTDNVGHIDYTTYNYYQRRDSITNKRTKMDILSQTEQMITNQKIIDLIIGAHSYSNMLNKELEFNHFSIKKWFVPAIEVTSDYQIWKKIYSNINYKLFANKYISIKDKIISLLILTHLYLIVKRK